MMQSSEKPLVSVCCVTYNHASYIRDCLEGFVTQQTSFPFEVLVHDDASTDGTADIIREYEMRYPNIIKPIYQTENQYSKGVNVGQLILAKVRGKYIALCDGDDFWLTPRKLQLQFDFMEKHPEFSICFHDVDIIDERNEVFAGADGKKNKAWGNLTMRNVFTITDLLRYGNLMNTPSVFYRTPSQTLSCQGVTVDYFLHLQIAACGKIMRLDGAMACYRVHGGGIMHRLQRGSFPELISACRKQIIAWSRFCRSHTLSRLDSGFARKRMLREYDRLRSFLLHNGEIKKAKRIAMLEIKNFPDFLFCRPIGFTLIIRTFFVR